MDKFDQIIQKSKQNIEPSANFVDVTMDKITNRKVKKHWGLKLWAPILGGSLAVVALLFVTLSPGNHIFTSKTPASKIATKASYPSQVATVTEAPGTDNSALASYLSGVQGSMNQENTDQSSANSYINDSQQEIAVPTD